MNGSVTSTTVMEEPQNGYLDYQSQPHSNPRHGLRSHSPSRRASSALSKTYKAASTLYLTRRLPEALQTIEPLITATPPAATTTDDEEGANGTAASHHNMPPVALANRSLRVKIWNFYLTLLNAIIELGPEDGKAAFGSSIWRGIVAKVRDGGIWEEVVQAGYGGSEGAVDADVVANLSTLLLSQAQSQALNQTRLETYLSFSSFPEMALAERLNGFESAMPSSGMQRRPSQASGTNTPRDLNSRAKVLELYTLHVLPRNEEWETAREFIRASNDLDEERQEAFLYTLDSLQQQALNDRDHEAALLRQRDEELARQRQEAEDKRLAESRMLEERSRASEVASQRSAASSSRGAASLKGHYKSNSEVDYGIDEPTTPTTPTVASHSQSSKRARIKKPATQAGGSGSNNGSGKSTSRSSGTRGSKRLAAAASSSSSSSRNSTLLQRLPALLGMLRRALAGMAQTMTKDPTVLMRNVLFLLALVLAFARRDVRARFASLAGTGWNKVMATVGMGTKVSYI